MFRTISTLLLSLAVSATCFAQSQDTDIRPNADQLTGDQIKSIFSDAEMDGAYNFGRNGINIASPSGRRKWSTLLDGARR